MSWQPIETAPKDGTRIILSMKSLGSVFGRWEIQKYSKKPRPYWTCDKESSLGTQWIRNNQPTHWMPEPESPNSQNQSQPKSV